MATVAQVSFSAGEISPSLAERVDLARYSTALRRCENFLVRPTGGVSNRPGLQYIDTVPGAAPGLLVPFVFAEDEAYVLLFRSGYMQPYALGAAVGSPVATPYLESDLGALRWTQSADVLTLAHPDYAQREVRRTGASTFTCTPITALVGGPFLDENTTTTTLTASAATGAGITLTASAAVFNANHVGALVKLIEEDLSAIPPWEPGKRLVDAGGNPNGLLRRSDGKVYECTTNAVAPANGTWTGTVRPVHDEGTETDGDGNPVPTVSGVAGVKWLYRHSGFGIAKVTAYTSSTSVTADVVSRIPDSCVSANTTKYWQLGAWSADQGYPSCVTYYSDRIVYAATRGQPQTEWASKVGNYYDFGVSSPVRDDDAITQTLNARQINPIRELLPLDQLLALTASAAWASPRRGELWTPQTLGFDPQSYQGSADGRAVIAGETALYASQQRTRLRDITYQFDSDKFRGTELTVLARHLFAPSRTIVEFDYAEHPDGVLWLVRSDGVLCSLTYLREQEVIGWARHETDGDVERVCVIPEDGRDALYLIVRRTLGVSTVRYLERLSEREIDDARDGVFVDSSLSFDGRNTTTATLSLGGGTFLDGEPLLCDASAAVFDLGNPPDEVRLRAGDAFIRCAVTATNSTSQLEVLPIGDVPGVLQNVPTADWDVAFDTFSGLGHLEGREVAICADAAEEPRQSVAAGAVTLAAPAVVVHVGLPYVSEIETLDINVAARQSIRERAKRIAAVAVTVQDTVGLQAGGDEDSLEELVQRQFEDYAEPVDPASGVVRFRIANTWDANGRILIRQVAPLPATVLAVMPQADLGEPE